MLEAKLAPTLALMLLALPPHIKLHDQDPESDGSYN